MQNTETCQKTSISTLLKKIGRACLPNKLVQKLKGSDVRIPVIRLSGVIGAASALRKGLDYASMQPHIEKAFKTRKAKAIALIINSPGGSPAQSHLIAKRIRELAEEKKLPVYAFVEDVAASGGYMLACAADEIYADPTSILGSIGVVSSGFGFTGLIEKIGIERRVHTAGKNKAILDPFLPEKAEDIERLKDLQKEIHEFFISFVRKQRNDKLKEDFDDLFTGAFWVGDALRQRGLIDGFGSVHSVLKEKYGDDLKLIPVQNEKKSLLSFILGGSGTSLSLGSSRELLETLEEHSIWNRYGL